MKNQPYANFITIGGVEAHARKGYRGLSRPRGTNKRRKLNMTGALAVPLSRANRLHEQAWNGARWLWGKAKRLYAEHAAARTAEREAAAFEADIAAKRALLGLPPEVEA